MSYYVRMCCGFSYEGIQYNPGDSVPEDVARIHAQRVVQRGDTGAQAQQTYETRVEPEVETRWEPVVKEEEDAEES